MEIIEFSHVQLSLAKGISVSQKNNILTNRIILQISGKKQISALTVKNGTTVYTTYLPCACQLQYYLQSTFTGFSVRTKPQGVQGQG